MSRGLSTRKRILFAGLVPLVLFAVVLEHYFLRERLQDRQEQFAQLGESYARELAAAARYGLFVADSDELRQIAGGFTERRHVHSVAIRGTANRLTIVETRVTSDTPGERFLHPFSAEVIPEPVIAIEEDPAFGPPASGEGVARTGLGTVTVTLTSEEARHEAWVLVRNSLALLLVGLLLATALLWRASRQIAKPIESITDLVRQAAQGQFDPRVRTGATGELADLEQGVNTMLDALQEHQQELQQRITRATAELQTRNLELEQARQTALQASRAKSEFLAQMSHEIRTPMHGILGFVELLDRSALEPPQRQQLQFIRGAALELMQVINQVLDFSRIEAGRIERSQEPVDIRALATAVCQLLTPEAVAKGLDCRLSIDERVPKALMTDALWLRQIMSNLVSNAIKYTPEGSVTITIEADVLPGALCGLTITVQDTGIGIAPEDLERIFEPFTQVDIGNRRSYQGTGLGLAIVKRLVDSMNADIEVQSAPGRGSVFRVRLRLPVALTSVREGAPDERRTRAADHALEELSVLAVDDNRVNRHLLEAMLTAHGARVSLAANGTEAVEKARAERFDSILMDIHMPGIGGIVASRMIRGLQNHADVPIIAISADAISRSLIEREMPFIAGYLVKPVEESVLVQAISDCVRRAAEAAPAGSGTAPGRVTEAGRSLRIGDAAVLGMFREDLPAELETIARALSEQDWTRLAEAVHALKGAAAVCALDAIFEDLQCMQRAVGARDSKSAQDCLSRLHRNANTWIEGGEGMPEARPKDGGEHAAV